MPTTASSTTQPSTNRYISLQEGVALGYGKYSTLRSWAADGRLPTVTIGGRVKLALADLDSLASTSNTVAPRNQLDKQVIEAAVDAVVERAPKLSAAQAARLATILGGAQ